MSFGEETYQIASRAIEHNVGRLDNVVVFVWNKQCSVTLMVIKTTAYDKLLGLDFCTKLV